MKKTSIIAALLTISACTTSPADNWQQHTTPMSGGNYSAEARGADSDTAKQNTLLVARAACNAEGGKLAVINETSKYDGPTGFAGTVAKAGELGAILYGKNTGQGVYFTPDEHYKHSIEFSCNN